MPSATLPAISADEMDDLLYLARTNDIHTLRSDVDALAKSQNTSTTTIITAIKDSDSGNTLLHYASANGGLEVLQYLLHTLAPTATTELNVQPGGAATSAMGLRLDLQNEAGNTPLHWAAMNGHLDVVKLLVERGANLRVQNQAGHDATFEAERGGKEEVVAWLLGQQKGVEESSGREEESAEEDAGEAVGEEISGEDGGNGNGKNEHGVKELEHDVKKMHVEGKRD
ncbi:MAG: hypothetical protein LQ350_001785 [Teloschistes chrysophthalmus]|nr:MAG: hypothetical protein LQ350_001785 [Niorma chrysophthalma]